MLLSDEKFSRLLLLLYEGASDPERMQAFLGELVRCVNAKGAIFRGHSLREQSGSVQIASARLSETFGYPAEALELYKEYYWQRDVYLSRAMERYRTADCGASQMLMTDSERKRTEMYADYQVRFDIGPMIWAKIAESENYHAAISLVRGNNSPAFEEASLQLLTALVPHLRQALRISTTLRDLEQTNSMLKRGVDDMEIALCLVRQDGTVIRSTASAERLFSKRDGIWLEKNRLKVSGRAEQGILDQVISAACKTVVTRGLNSLVRVEACAAGRRRIRSWTAGAGGAILIGRRPPLGPIQAVVSPFLSGGPLLEREATALVQLCDPNSIPRPRSTLLRSLYGLSPIEARIADLLVRGFEVRDAAERIQNTIETTRFYVKQILAKTGTHNQRELIRIMLSLPGADSDEGRKEQYDIPGIAE